MQRHAEQKDQQALTGLWQQVFGDTPAFANMVFEQFAGLENLYVEELDGRPAALLCAVPVTLRGKKGAYYYGLATRPDCRGKGIMTGLMDYAEADLKQQGCQFACLVPAEPSLFGYYEQRGFQKAFGLRRVSRPIAYDIWSQCEFDSITARQLPQLRERYWPDSVLLNQKGMACVLTDLYSSGATLIGDKFGYGVYLEKGDTLEFLELFAETDGVAEKILQAARQRIGTEKAVITLPAESQLFLGEGKREDYGMIKFFGQPFDVLESYMRLMLDNE